METGSSYFIFAFGRLNHTGFAFYIRLIRILLKVPTYEICFKRPCARPEKDLFITQYWSDNQSDPPLHFHEDYMLSLTLNVRGTRITGPYGRRLHRKGPDHHLSGRSALLHARRSLCRHRLRSRGCAVQPRHAQLAAFRNRYLQPIQKMLSLPVAGLSFLEMVVDGFRERLLQLPGLRGFESVALFLDILNDLATAGPDEMHIIGTTDYKTQADGNERIKKILQFVENNYHNKITLEDHRRRVGMSHSSVCRYFKKNTCQNLWNYIKGFASCAPRDDRGDRRSISEISTRCGFTTSRIQPRSPRAHRLSAGRIPAQIRLDGDFTRPEAGRGDRPQTRRFTQRREFVRGGGKSALRDLFGKRERVI